MQPLSNLHSTKPAQVHYTYEVTAPYTALLTKIPEEGTSKDGWRESIGLFICPLTPETCRVWFRLAVADFESTDEQLQAFQHTIFTQDQPVLESQLPKALPLDPRAELHSAAARMSSAYRRYLKSSGVTF
ncbi:putative methylxanthine N7-demethylase NdmC [compost metagenome]